MNSDDDDGPATGTGGGDNSQIFRKFVQEHLKAFFKPVAEHVEELKSDLAELRMQVKFMQSSFSDRVGANEGKLGKVLQDLATMSAEHEKEASTTTHSMAALSRRIVCLESSCQAASATVQQCEIRADTQQKALEDMKEALDNSNSNVNRLQLKHWQTQNLAQKVESAIAELKDEHLALCERHTSLARSLTQTQQGIDAQRLAQGAMHSRCDAMDKKIAEQVDSLGNKLLVLERALSKVKDVQSEQSKEVLPLSSDIKRLAQTVARLDEQFEAGNQVEEPDAGTARQHHGHPQQRVMVDMEGAIQEIRQIAQAGGDKKFQEMVHALVNRVKQHTTELAEVLPAMHSAKSALAAQQETVSELEGKVREHENRHNGAQDRLNRVEGDITSINSGVHDLQCKVQSQGTELEKAQSNQVRMLKDLSEAQTVLKGHSAELKASEQVQLQLQTRVEVAYEYLHGLGKGFQDTHRSILGGNDGLLAPRPASAQKGALPTLTVPQPRTNGRLTEFVRPNTSPSPARSK